MSSSLSEHLPLLASTPDGIKKLRGLILELAVRGKLVAQDPNDEPASELLKRIALERKTLEAAGTFKKSKATPISETDNAPFDLPQGWSWVRLGHVASAITKGATPTTYGHSYKSEGVRFVKVENVSNRRIEKHTATQFIDATTDQLLARSRLEAGDILFSIAGTIGKTCLVTPSDLPANTNQALAIIKGTGSAFVADFLLNQLDSVAGHRTREKARGGAMNNVSLGDLVELVLATPPLAEQHRIVAKVDELMALCDRLEAEQADSGTAHARLVETLLGTLSQSPDADELAASWQLLAGHFDTLFTTEASVDALKQTILQLAVMGKLVPQDPADEPASSLLSRIEQERVRMVAEGKCKQSKPMPPIEESERPFRPPEGWQWSRWGDITHWMTYGFTRPMPHVNFGPTILTAKNVFGGTIDFQNVHFTTDEAFAALSAKDLPSDGDILITKDGSIGRAAVVPPSAPKFCINQSVAVLWLRDIPVNRSFLVNAIHSALLQERIWAAAEGAAIKHISITDFVKFPLPLPPLAEQHRIVAKVDELMALCDRLKADLVDSRSRQARLADTLIAAALEAA